MTRRATIILALLLVVLQGQLWLGRGSVTEVWQLEQQLAEHRRQNEQTELVIARSRAELSDLTDGLIKSVVFAFLIAIVACQQGLSTKGGATGVGRSTTRSVVLCVMLITIADVFLANLLKHHR